MLVLPALGLVAWLCVCADAEVLVVQFPGKEKRQFTAVQANWNEALQDATSQLFAGEIYAELENLDGCKPLHETGARNRLVLLRGEPCGSEPGTEVKQVLAAAEQGAAGVIFFKDKLEGLAHLHYPEPQIRAVIIDSRGGKEILAEFLLAQVSQQEQQPQVGIYAELSIGLALAEDAYQDIYIFRLDEQHATRETNFIWHERPGVLHSRGAKKILSQEVMELIKGSFRLERWFTTSPSVLPLFNPSILALDDVAADSEEGEITSSFLVALRMSNGPGCPGLKEASSETRIFHNALLLLLVDAFTFEVIDHCEVETPPVLSAFFGSAGGDSSEEDTDESSNDGGQDQSSNETADEAEVPEAQERAARGRQFLDEVHGPMDARLHRGDDGQIWVSFYAERSSDDYLQRGMHVAPLQLRLRPCEEDAESSSSHERFEMEAGEFIWRPVDGTLLRTRCDLLGWGNAGSLDACKQSCDGHCDGVITSDGVCALLKCSADLDADVPSQGFPAKWHAWRKQRGSATHAWHPIHPSMMQHCKQAGVVVSTENEREQTEDHQRALNCRENCELASGCNAACFHGDAGLCSLQMCGIKLDTNTTLDSHLQAEVLQVAGWQCWVHRLKGGPEQQRGKSKRQCLERAWIDAAELIGFQSDSTSIEKNWGFFHVRQSGFMIEYLLEPHIILEAHLERAEGPLKLSAISSAPSMTRFPPEVLHGLSNIRGGYCCLEIPARLWEHFDWTETLGAHLQAHGIPFPSGPLLLGCAHLQRIRTPADHFHGDLDRYRRQAKTRTYHHIFYLLRSTEPFDVVALSTEWCISLGGRFSRPWKDMFDEKGEIACEALQFVAGLALRRVQTSSVRSSASGSTTSTVADMDLVLSYGMNDCEADILALPLSELFSILRPVHSTWNVTFTDKEI